MGVLGACVTLVTCKLAVPSFPAELNIWASISGLPAALYSIIESIKVMKKDVSEVPNQEALLPLIKVSFSIEHDATF